MNISRFVPSYIKQTNLYKKLKIWLNNMLWRIKTYIKPVNIVVLSKTTLYLLVNYIKNDTVVYESKGEKYELY